MRPLYEKPLACTAGEGDLIDDRRLDEAVVKRKSGRVPCPELACAWPFIWNVCACDVIYVSIQGIAQCVIYLLDAGI
jgi:hypothetical protein